MDTRRSTRGQVRHALYVGIHRQDGGRSATSTSTVVVQARRRRKIARTAPHDASCSLLTTAHPLFFLLRFLRPLLSPPVLPWRPPS